MDMPVSACQLEAWHSPNTTGNAWNPSAFTGGKQADNQRQPVGLQTQVRRGERGMEVQTGGNEMRRGVFGGRKRWRFFAG